MPDVGRAPERKPLEVVAVQAPPVEQRVRRGAEFTRSGEKPNRYTLPARISSSSPVGYRTRISITREEAKATMALLSLSPPTGFEPPTPISEGELFDESALGILVSRQSTNYRGHKQITLGPKDSADILPLLRDLEGPRAHAGEQVLDNPSYTHVVLSRPYRTPFTMLLTFVGHKPVASLASVPFRALRKRFAGAVDIPTIGYLQQLHLGILADTMERATVVASKGLRRAQVLVNPYLAGRAAKNAKTLRALEAKIGLTGAERREGWRVSMVVQVGNAKKDERVELPEDLWPKLGANFLAFRSERIQPGVNQEKKAPEQYHSRQDMNVPENFTFQAGRAAYNAFARWTGFHREGAKALLMMERIDVLSPGGKERLRGLRDKLGEITDRIVKDLPLWADLPTGKAFSRNAARGRKAFALAGQRVYVAGLDQKEVRNAGLEWDAAVRATGAASARSALYSELMGIIDLPEDCDLLAGICMMAGPVNQDDIGKTYYGMKDLLADAFPKRKPTSLLVWTLKAKTIADPIGNEEQLMNAARKGALVDLRAGPHEVVDLRIEGKRIAMRAEGNKERGFSELGNFVQDGEGFDIPGNPGEVWPERDKLVWG